MKGYLGLCGCCMVCMGHYDYDDSVSGTKVLEGYPGGSWESLDYTCHRVRGLKDWAVQQAGQIPSLGLAHFAAKNSLLVVLVLAERIGMHSLRCLGVILEAV